MIPRDTLQLIIEQAVKAAPQTRFVKAPGEPADTYYMVDVDGALSEKIRCEPDPRRYVAASVEDFCALVGPRVDNKGLVFVGEKGLTALLDEETRRERITFPLSETPGSKVLASLAKDRGWFSQESFVFLLRVNLNGCVDKLLVEQFKKIKFQENSEGEAVIDTGKKAISSRVQAQCQTQGQDIPEEITVTLALYEQFPDFKFLIRCAVAVDTDEQKFTLVPLAGELSTASVETRQRIKGMVQGLLPGGNVAVHCGETN